MPLQVGGDAERDSVVLLNDITITPDADLCVPKNQVFKFLIENLSIASAPLALALVLGGNAMSPWWDWRSRESPHQ